jgi:hypothetical protein
VASEVVAVVRVSSVLLNPKWLILSSLALNLKLRQPLVVAVALDYSANLKIKTSLLPVAFLGVVVSKLLRLPQDSSVPLASPSNRPLVSLVPNPNSLQVNPQAALAQSEVVVHSVSHSNHNSNS